MELAKHADLTKEIGIPIYFCDPQCPWQRGTNENTNGLIRQCFTKKTDLSIHSQKPLSEVANQLNERPRKKFRFKTPSLMIDKSVTLPSAPEADRMSVTAKDWFYGTQTLSNRVCLKINFNNDFVLVLDTTKTQTSE